MTNESHESIREYTQNAESAVINQIQEGKRIIYEGDDERFLINGPNHYQGTITDTNFSQNVVIVDGVQEVRLDRIVEIEHDS